MSIAVAACLLLQSGGLAAAETAITVGTRNGTVQRLLGINIGPLPAGSTSNADLTAQYRAQSIQLIRTHDYYGPLDMARLYPDRSKDPSLATSYNFTQAVDTMGNSSDAVFASIVNNGFEPFFRLGDSYNNVQPPSAAEHANWVAAAVNVLRHYRLGQWNGFTSTFRYVEVWNEPDNTKFWPAPATQAQFLALYDATAKAVRTAFPELKIGGPGLTQQGCTSQKGKAYTAAFLDYVKANGSPLDYFSWHIYTNNPQDVANCAAYYRQQLDARGYTTVPTILSEWNTDAERPEQTSAEKAELRTQGKGAAIVTGGWIGLQNRDDVAQQLFYRGPDPAMDAPFFYGIYSADGQPKKAALAHELWRNATQYPYRLAVSGQPSDLYILASEDAQGVRNMLVANTASTALDWIAGFADGRTAADYQIATLTVSDASTTTATATATSTRFTTPANAVQQIVFTPRALGAACSATAKSAVYKAYVGYYARCPDAPGLAYWCGKLDEASGNMAAIIASFGTSAEYTARFSGLTDAQLIGNLYQNLFHRNAEAAGATFYQNLLAQWRSAFSQSHGNSSSGATEYALSRIALDVLNGAAGGDLTTLNTTVAACPAY